MLARPLGMPEYPRVPGQHWEGASHSRASPAPRFADWENEKNQGRTGPICRKCSKWGSRGAREIACALLSVEACGCTRFLCVYAGMRMTLVGHQRL